jgi:hypothetical protein
MLKAKDWLKSKQTQVPPQFEIVLAEASCIISIERIYDKCNFYLKEFIRLRSTYTTQIIEFNYDLIHVKLKFVFHESTGKTKPEYMDVPITEIEFWSRYFDFLL